MKTPPDNGISRGVVDFEFKSLLLGCVKFVLVI